MQQDAKFLVVALRGIGILGTFLFGITTVVGVVLVGSSHVLVMGMFSVACVALWIFAQCKLRDTGN